MLNVFHTRSELKKRQSILLDHKRASAATIVKPSAKKFDTWLVNLTMGEPINTLIDIYK